MESNGKRLRQEQQQHSEESLQESSTTEVRMYHSVEDLLRKDAAQNPPPDTLSLRVATSTGEAASQNPKPWWKKLLGN
ncbi:MAG: hypothetical protein ACO1QS_06540 [Verrucomicrobiota bacterium]